MNKERYKPDEISETLKAKNGYLFGTARSLNCTIGTIQNYINKYPEVKETYESIRHGQIDFVESCLINACKNGNVSAIIFFLRTVGKKRGYTYEPENETTDNKIEITVRRASERKC